MFTRLLLNHLSFQWQNIPLLKFDGNLPAITSLQVQNVDPKISLSTLLAQANPQQSLLFAGKVCFKRSRRRLPAIPYFSSL